MNVALSASQNNTKRGQIGALAAVDLTNAEGRLVKLGSVNGVRQATLPTALADAAVYVCLKPVSAGVETTVERPSGDDQFRVVAKGAGTAGTLLSLADMTAVPADAGKLRAVPNTAASTFYALAIAEEDFVDGQLVLCRPFLRTVVNP